MIRSRKLLLLLLLLTPFSTQAGSPLEGLEAPVKVVRDNNGIPHIYAANAHDLFFMQGRVHAEDRLFQMDLLRRSAAGTLAEVLGPPAIDTDIETRTIGFTIAANKSLEAHSAEMRAILQAYSDGVNSYIGEIEAADSLPPEYTPLGLSQIKRWEPLDSVLVGKALAAATSLIVVDDIELSLAFFSYQIAAQDPDNEFNPLLLFFEDLYRSAPFDPASTVPDALSHFHAAERPQWPPRGGRFKSILRKQALEHGRDYLERIRKLPRIPGALPFDGDNMGGSNSWVVSGKHTPSRRPLLANDIHLSLEAPVIFHELHLVSPDLQATGSSLPGAPCVVRGHNRSIAWGITNSRLDVSDIYQETLVPDSGPSGFATLHNGTAIPIDARLEDFFANVGGNLVHWTTQPVLTLPYREGAPIIDPPRVDPTGKITALSLQTVGLGPTLDPEGICGLNRAHNLDEFKAAIQLIDFASQNLTYADRKGNIAYFVTGELPLREDLQNLAPTTPPFLIRTGEGGEDWIRLEGELPANQATPYAILPFDEMPQVVNPPGGIIVNANNDQIGNSLDNNPLNDLRDGANGLKYLNWGGRNFSIRAGRITDMLDELLASTAGKPWRRPLSFARMQQMQADTVLNDARELLPYLLSAYDNASDSGAPAVLAALAGDSRIAEAVARLRDWKLTTPTGIDGGYDADAESASVDASIAATIYATWRGAVIKNSIDKILDGIDATLATKFGLDPAPRPSRREELVTALKHLLERDGIGESGLVFFDYPGAGSAAVARDAVVLASLADALDLLASDAFAAAFGNSTNQDDYRWGKLHRIVLNHPLGGLIPDFNVPPAFNFFPSAPDGIAGIPTDGGFETVDVAPPRANNVRVDDSDSMRFQFGPTGRFVAWLGPRVSARTSLPGGNSSVPGSPYYVNLLEPYLNNESFPLRTSPFAVKRNAASTERYFPAAP